MNGKARILAAIAILGLALLFQPQARADVTLEMTGGGTGYFMGGMHTSPYVLSLNGVVSLALACDDVVAEAYPGDQWTATATFGYPQDLVASGNVPEFQFGGNTQEMQQSYDAAGLLAYNILTDFLQGSQKTTDSYTGLDTYSFDATKGPWADPSTWVDASSAAGESSYQFGIMSWALWSLFDPNWTSTYLPGVDGAPTDTSIITNLANQYLQEAQSETVYMAILTPDSAGSDGSNPQEFLGVLGTPQPTGWGGTSPEGSSVAFLAFDLLVLLAGIFLVRKRLLAR